MLTCGPLAPKGHALDAEPGPVIRERRERGGTGTVSGGREVRYEDTALASKRQAGAIHGSSGGRNVPFSDGV